MGLLGAPVLTSPPLERLHGQSLRAAAGLKKEGSGLIVKVCWRGAGVAIVAPNGRLME